MTSKRVEEKREKIIRGLMKLPCNRNCINCNILGAQYVCINFSTFVCTTCSGIHREFTHRVKSVSMAKFTAEEVEALQKGGNQHAKDVFLKEFDTQRMRLPNNRNVDKIREFIKDVYVHEKYAGGRYSDDSSKDKERLNSYDEDEWRSSSFHSCTQSPSPEIEHKDRHHREKQTSTDSRWPRSDHVLRFHKGNVPSSVQNPGPIRGLMHNKKLSTVSSGLRLYDSQLSSGGNRFILHTRTPNIQDNEYSSHNMHQGWDIANEKNASANRDTDWYSCRERSSSTESFVSLASSPKSTFTNSRSDSFKTASSKSVSGSDDFTGTEIEEAFTVFASPLSSCRNVEIEERKATTLTPPMNFFADFSNPASSTATTEQNIFAAPFSGTEGWVTFDVSESVGFVSQTNTEVSSVTLSDDTSTATENVLATTSDSQRSSSQSSLFSIPFTSRSDQPDLFMGHQDTISSSDQNYYQVSSQSSLFSTPFISRSEQLAFDMSLHQDIARSSDQQSIQPWHTFDDSIENTPCTLVGKIPQHNMLQISSHTSPAYDDLPMGEVRAVHTPKSINPFDLPYYLDSEANNVVFDMNNLQTALPYQDVPPFLDEPNQQWFPFTQGGLAYIEGQGTSSNLLDLRPQGSAPFLGGNPFA